MEESVDKTRECFSLVRAQGRETVFVCPNCWKGIPLISLGTQENSITITISCKCLEKSTFTLYEYFQKIKKNPTLESNKCKAHSRSAQVYCVDCMKWLCNVCFAVHNTSRDLAKHHLCDYEINLQCLTHETQFSKYCNNCNDNFCFKCGNNHQSHSTIELTPGDIKEVLLPLLEIVKRDPLLFREIEVLRTCILSTYQMSKKFPIFYSMNIPSAIVELNNLILKKPLNEPIRFIGHTDKIVGVLQLKSGNLVSYSSDGIICIWDINAPQLLATLKGHTKFISKVLEFGDNLVSSSGDLTIKVWSSRKYDCLGTLTGHVKIINEIKKINDKLLASKSMDSIVMIWDIISLKCLEKIEFSNKTGYYKNKILFHLSNNQFSIYNFETNIIQNSIQCNNPKFQMTSRELSYSGEIIKLRELRDGNLCVSDNNGTSIITASSKNCQTKQILQSKNCFLITELSLGYLAMITDQNAFKIINPSTAQCHSIVKFDKSKGAIIKVIELSDGRLAAHSNSDIHIINPITYQSVTIFCGHSRYICTVFEPCKGQLASCSWDGTMKIWNTLNFEEIVTLPVDINWIPVSLADGRLVIVSKDEAILEIW